MSRSRRVYTIAAALTLAGGAASSVMAQIPGMPLFTNPRYSSGIRVHADAGKPMEEDPNRGDLVVFQGGVSLALGPLGLNANVGTTRATAKAAQGCVEGPTVDCASATATVGALAQLRIMGNRESLLSLSLFGGGSMDLDTSAANCTGSGCTPDFNNRQVNIPVGVAVGLRIPLGLATLNLWGAPRYNMTRFVNCTGTCTSPKPSFGYALGADLPIFRIISVRAAYDNHKDKLTNRNVAVVGVGASIGIGGMR